MFIIKILVLFLMMFHNAFCFSKHPSEEQIQMYDYLKLHKEYSQDVFNLYEKNVAKLLWIEDSKVSSNVLDLIEAIKKSKYHGLIPNQYYLNEITTLVNEKSTNIYKLDTLLSAAFCKLARDLHFAQHHSEVSVIGQKQKEENFDLHRLLIQALKSKSIQGTLKSLAPKHTYYWRLYDYLKQHDVTSMDEKLIATNMDRWRLYTSEVPKNYILINLAAFW